MHAISRNSSGMAWGFELAGVLHDFIHFRMHEKELCQRSGGVECSGDTLLQRVDRVRIPAKTVVRHMPVFGEPIHESGRSARERTWAGEGQHVASQNAVVRKSSYRELCLRWHPDKFSHRYGNLLDPQEKDRILARVAALFVSVQKEWEALNDGGPQ